MTKRKKIGLAIWLVGVVVYFVLLPLAESLLAVRLLGGIGFTTMVGGIVILLK